MSDDLNTSQADGAGIDLQQFQSTQVGELFKIQANIADTIKNTPLTAEKRDGLNKALGAAMNELNPQKSPFSSLAAGGSVVHRDPFKQQSLVEAGFNAAATAMNNPVLALVGRMLAGDNKGAAVQNLAKALGDAGISKIKGVDVNVVLGNAQAHSNAKEAVDSLGRSGITGRIYPPEGQVITKGGLGQTSEAAFVMHQAFRANNGELKAVQELTKPPVKLSEAQKRINNEMGVQTGATTTQVKAQQFTGTVKLEERYNAARLNQAVRDQGQIPRASANKTNKNDLMALAPTPPSTLKVQNSLVASVNNTAASQIDKIGQDHEAAMQKQDEIAKGLQAQRAAALRNAPSPAPTPVPQH